MSLRGRRHLVITDRQPFIDNHRRSDTKRDHIGEGIELLADGRCNLQNSGTEAVAEVEDGGDHDPDGGEGEIAVQRGHRGETPADQVETGQGVGNMLFDVDFDHKTLTIDC